MGSIRPATIPSCSTGWAACCKIRTRSSSAPRMNGAMTGPSCSSPPASMAKWSASRRIRWVLSACIIMTNRTARLWSFQPDRWACARAFRSGCSISCWQERLSWRCFRCSPSSPCGSRWRMVGRSCSSSAASAAATSSSACTSSVRCGLSKTTPMATARPDAMMTGSPRSALSSARQALTSCRSFSTCCAATCRLSDRARMLWAVVQTTNISGTSTRNIGAAIASSRA